jgi:hypothetical protein
MTVTNHAAHIALRDRASRLRSPSMLAPVRCLSSYSGPGLLLQVAAYQWRFSCQLRKSVPQYHASAAKSAVPNLSHQARSVTQVEAVIVSRLNLATE